MWNRIKLYLMSPIFEGDEEKTNSARLLHSLVLIIILTATLYPIISLLLGSSVSTEVGYLVVGLIIISIGLGIFMRRGYVQASAIILGLTLWGMFTYGAYTFGGLHDTSITGFFFLIILVGVAAGWQTLIGFSLLSIFSLIGLYLAEQYEIITPSLTIPSDTADLVLPLVIIGGSTFILYIAVNFLTEAYDRAKRNANRLEQTNRELQENRDALAERTQALERRTRYLEATTTVARDVASELNPDALVQSVVNLITQQFNFYHTGLFIIEVGGEYAVLQAASSIGGQRMLERGHRLRIGEEGIVGAVASEGRSRVALDTGTDAVYFDNPDLPETRSEAALPLQVRGEIIGVLDVQSTMAEAFGDEDIAALQTLADQIAVALQTAQLFQQVEESLEVQRRAYGEMSQEAWNKIATTQENIGYRYIQGDVVIVNEQPTTGASDLPEIAIPVQIGKQTIGQITAHKSAVDTDWSPDEISVMESISNQLSVALESARLYQDSQERAARERLTGEVTGKIRETLDIETIIKTASEEIRKTLNLPEVVIRLGEPASNHKKGITE